MNPHQDELHLGQAQSDLSQLGYAVVHGYVPSNNLIKPLWESIHSVAGVIAKSMGLVWPKFENGVETSDAILGLAKQDRAFVAKIYDQAKQLPAFLQLASWEGFAWLFQHFFPGSVVGIGESSYGVRFDLPWEEQFRSHWHQEHAYNPQSPEGLVFWVPLTDLNPDMGGVEILAGSHVEGTIHHAPLAKYGSKSGLYQVGIPTEDLLTQRYEVHRPIVRAGDLVVMRFDCVHQSGFNRSSRLRATLQVRYFDFLDPIGIVRGWPSSPSAYFGYEVSGKK